MIELGSLITIITSDSKEGTSIQAVENKVKCMNTTSLQETSPYLLMQPSVPVYICPFKFYGKYDQTT